MMVMLLLHLPSLLIFVVDVVGVDNASNYFCCYCFFIVVVSAPSGLVVAFVAARIAAASFAFASFDVAYHERR
jgi:hypothetical protein